MTYKMWKWIGNKLSYGGRYIKESDEAKERSLPYLERAFTPKLKHILEENKNG